jgi:hypothetical protein
MIKTKAKSQPQPGASSEASDLATRIKKTCAEAQAYIESKVTELKDAPEGKSLPIDWLRLNIRATTRAGGCHCKCALALLEKTPMEHDQRRRRRRQQAKVLAEITALPPSTTIEGWNAQRFTADILDQTIRELRASFIVPDKRLH